MEGNFDNVIVKAIQDKEFRELLFRDKERALSQFRLTEDETKSLHNLDQRTFDKAIAEMGTELQRRIALGGADLEGGRIHSRDYPVIVVED